MLHMWIPDSLNISGSSEKLESWTLYIILRARSWSFFYKIVWLSTAEDPY